MNKTENKTQAVGFSNIKEMQNLIKTNGIPNLAASLKSFRQKLNAVGAKIVEVKKSAESKTTVKAPVVSEPKEVKVEQPAKVEAPVQQKAEPVQKPVREQQNARGSFAGGNGYQNRNAQNGGGFNRAGQNGFGQRQNGGFGQRPTGKFTPTGERRFDNNGDGRRPNSYSNDNRFGKPGI